MWGIYTEKKGLFIQIFKQSDETDLIVNENLFEISLVRQMCLWYNKEKRSQHTAGDFMNDTIRIKGARENNLKGVDLTIPRDKLVVFTGLSGSGKSSLAFDTIYAEGQRRYVESLSSYARQFLGQMDKPDVDSIDGLSPAISIDQKTTSKNPRSLWAR